MKLTKTNLILRNTAYEQRQYDLAEEVRKRYGLGGKGFSAAVRMLIENGALILLPEADGDNGNTSRPPLPVARHSEQ